MSRERLLSVDSNEERYDAVEGSPGISKEASSEEYYLEEGRLFEEAISSTGFGCFHFILLFVCGWALASDSVEIQVVIHILIVSMKDIMRYHFSFILYDIFIYYS